MKSFEEFLFEREQSLLSREEIMSCEYYKKIIERGFVLDSTPRQINDLNFHFKFPKSLVIDPFFVITRPENHKFNSNILGQVNDTRFVAQSYIAYSNGVIYAGDKNSRINTIQDWENHFKMLYDYIVKNFEHWCVRQYSHFNQKLHEGKNLSAIVYTPENFSSKGEFQKKFSGFFEKEFIDFTSGTFEIPYLYQKNDSIEKEYSQKNMLIKMLSVKMNNSLSFSESLRELINIANDTQIAKRKDDFSSAQIFELIGDNIPSGLEDLTKKYRGQILSRKTGIV